MKILLADIHLTLYFHLTCTVLRAVVNIVTAAPEVTTPSNCPVQRKTTPTQENEPPRGPAVPQITNNTEPELQARVLG